MFLVGLGLWIYWGIHILTEAYLFFGFFLHPPLFFLTQGLVVAQTNLEFEVSLP